MVGGTEESQALSKRTDEALRGLYGVLVVIYGQALAVAQVLHALAAAAPQ